ncbi:unnamed protein product [Brassica oleracea]
MEKTDAREEKILVLVRLRPPNQKEIAANEPTEDWECLNDTTILYRRNTLRQSSNFPSAYSFDRVYGGECPTRHVYENGTKDIALSVVKGINCSIFAYGQTSSGKTYTMSAITEFAVADIFDYIFQHEERAFSVKFSAIEIYNEAIRDLLSSDGTSLRLRDDPEKGTVVEKATEETLRDWNHLKDLLSVCEAQRKIGETSLNERSSRSHQIIKLTVESSAREFLDKENSTTLMASVNFIDLAGSERASPAMSAGARLKEGCHINRSLLTLGTVIRKLSKGRQGHINFRDSKLTRILQPCLGGNSRTAIICTLSPARSHVELTRNTLLFACCAKEVTTKARINVVMSDKALLKQLQRELARLETELRTPATPASKCDCAMTVRKKNLHIQKMEKEMAELREERDLAQSRLEDIMRMVELDEASKCGTPQHIDKWEDGSVSQTSGVIDLERSFISDGMSITRAYVGSHSEDDDDEELPTRSEDPSEEYCREVQCIEIEESATVNHKDEKRAEPKNILGPSEDASVGQNVRLRSWNRRETAPGTSTPPENLGTGRPEEESHKNKKIVFSGLELGSSVSRNDSLSSCGSDSTETQSSRTPLGEEGGITSIRTFVDGLKEMAKRQGQVSITDDDSGKMGRDIGLVIMDMEFERQRREIVELWQTCNVSLAHRTYFYLLFKGDDEADSIYIGVELRRLLFMKARFSQGNQTLEGGETLTLASSRKALHGERMMLSKLVGKRFSGEERRRIYHKFGIAVNSKRRRLQLVNELWSNPKDMSQVVESADVVAKLVVSISKIQKKKKKRATSENGIYRRRRGLRQRQGSRRKRMESDGRYNPDYYKEGTHSVWNTMPNHHQTKEDQHNALVMNQKIMSILAERDAALKERDDALAAKQEALAARDEALDQRDKALSLRDNAILERDSALSALQFREHNLNYILSRAKLGSSHLPNPSPLSTIPHEAAPSKRKKKRKPETRSKGKRVGEDLNHHVASPGKKCRKDWDSNVVGLNLVTFDETTMPVPMCTCTGTARHCYKWGNGGWQSSCCTTTLSLYPLPQMPNKRHSRVGGRKMSGNVFSRLLSRLVGKGHDLSSPVDLKDYWARHGTNRYITIM